MLNLASIFVVVFLAELGDKTQLATLLLCSSGKSAPLGVFIAAALALCLSTGLAVLLGSVGARYLEAVPLKLIAGMGFIAIGVWSIVEYVRTA